MNLEPIDTSTTAGKAEVMRLAAEGREVVSRSGLPGYSWAKCPVPVWDWSAGEYAIIAKPDGPEEVWLSFNKEDGKLNCYSPEKPNWVVSGVSHERYIRADLAGEVK